jgi:hypothetical protein
MKVWFKKIIFQEEGLLIRHFRCFEDVLYDNGIIKSFLWFGFLFERKYPYIWDWKYDEKEVVEFQMENRLFFKWLKRLKMDYLYFILAQIGSYPFFQFHTIPHLEKFLIWTIQSYFLSRSNFFFFFMEKVSKMDFFAGIELLIFALVKALAENLWQYKILYYFFVPYVWFYKARVYFYEFISLCYSYLFIHILRLLPFTFLLYLYYNCSSSFAGQVLFIWITFRFSKVFCLILLSFFQAKYLVYPCEVGTTSWNAAEQYKPKGDWWKRVDFVTYKPVILIISLFVLFEVSCLLENISPELVFLCLIVTFLFRAFYINLFYPLGILLRKYKKI